jgi:hypothetical protein
MKTARRFTGLILFIAMSSISLAESMSSEEMAKRTLERRAVEAAIWGMPIVSVDAMRQAFFRDAGAKYGDIVYLSKPADWRLQITTPNASSLYVYFNYNLKDGPMVLEFPAAVGAGLFGSILDAWQAPLTDVGPAGEDHGKGGKYLIVPPNFEGELPAGYLAVGSATYNGYAAFRAIPKTQSEEDKAKAIGLVKQLRFYPLSQAANPPPQRHIDMAGKMFDGIARLDDTFYDSLAKMVNEEPVQMRDLVTMGQLKSLGIEKGKEFKPDAATREILKKAIAEAHAGFMDGNSQVVPYWTGAMWGASSYLATATNTAFTFQTTNWLDIDGRGNMFFIACAPPKKLGEATFYLFGTKDAQNAPLDGGKSYHLHVPPNVPAKQFWAVTVYDLETAGFIRESPKVEVNSYQNLQKNGDGSVEVYFGPKAPAGKESNWVSTSPGKRWVTIFRFYGPEKAVAEKTWKLPDIEPMQGEVVQPTGLPAGRVYSGTNR